MNTLKYLQSNEFLLDVDLWRLFTNLEELNKASLNFPKTFFETVKDHVSKSDSPMDFSSILRKFFQGDLCQTHQIYCLNYTSAVFYLENLRQRKDFGIYLKWCEQNEQCKRLHLPDLLVTPLHRLTRYPRLLNNIWKRSTDETEKGFIWSLKEKVEKSVRDLEGKGKRLDNFQKFRQLQEITIWAVLVSILHEQMADNQLTNFIFYSQKYGGSDTSLFPVCPSLTPELQSFIREGGFCTVLGQPIPLDRLILRNTDSIHITVFSLQNAFLIQHENRYPQCIAVFLLSWFTNNFFLLQKTWMSQTETAISNYTAQHETKKSTAFCFPDESSEI
uniref:Pleckstrin homology and RhoGEF domain containing G7 n=1 Tax=Otus sunia TaxID=257818 RepID=A0A8C8BML9_9STRI